jgi:hypothetical protein
MPHDELIERLHALADRQRRERGDIMYLGEHDPEISEAAEALTTMQAREVTLIRVLERCRAKFREYELLHLAKFTEDGDEKAGRNREMVAVCDEALGTSGLVEP